MTQILMITGNVFLSLDNFEISEIKVFVDISLSLISFADVCREHWHLVSWLWRVARGLYTTHDGNTLAASMCVWFIPYFIMYICILLVYDIIVFPTWGWATYFDKNNYNFMNMND